MEIMVKLSEKEKENLIKYARDNSLSLELVLKKMIYKRMEDEFDMYLAERAYLKYLREVTRSKSSFRKSNI
ncbi:DUF6290 family protein [Streptobacillus canis]|uniref:DUF6290 family protein n=1 Tax=Streptobacillus canis TaxID=2678686 RepID=UPI0012E29649|nr:DUF6290 family protein [Streptobacillus canis]